MWTMRGERGVALYGTGQAIDDGADARSPAPEKRVCIRGGRGCARVPG